MDIKFQKAFRDLPIEQKDLYRRTIRQVRTIFSENPGLALFGFKPYEGLAKSVLDGNYESALTSKGVNLAIRVAEQEISDSYNF